MTELFSQFLRVPVRKLFVYLSAIAYVLLCLAFACLAAWSFHFRLARLSGLLQLLSLLAAYLLVLALLDFLLAFVFSIVCHGYVFAVIRFLAAGLFFVLPATLLIFLFAIWISEPAVLSSAVTVWISSISVLPAISPRRFSVSDITSISV